MIEIIVGKWKAREDQVENGDVRLTSRSNVKSTETPWTSVEDRKDDECVYQGPAVCHRTENEENKVIRHATPRRAMPRHSATDDMTRHRVTPRDATL